MKLLIHDLEKINFQTLFPDISKDTMVISNNGMIHQCIGCFGCWIKSPGKCVIQDDYQNMGKHIAKCDELMIISRCCYGGFSPFVKNVLDRSISYVHPFFTNKNREMHHKARYKNHYYNLRVWFYGDGLTEKEKDTSHRLVHANATNLYCDVKNITFSNNIKELEGVAL